MKMKLRTKEDIQFRDRRPAVNVKIYDDFYSGYRKWRKHHKADPDFDLKWIEKYAEELGSEIFWLICGVGWKELTDKAREIWGPNVQVYSTGRSGGWAIVDGINQDVDSWDAVEFSKWRKFAKYARAVADRIMEDFVDFIYVHYYLESK